jgi:hypothetical protein
VPSKPIAAGTRETLSWRPALFERQAGHPGPRSGCVLNVLCESFFLTLECGLFDRQRCALRTAPSSTPARGGTPLAAAIGTPDTRTKGGSFSAIPRAVHPYDACSRRNQFKAQNDEKRGRMKRMWAIALTGFALLLWMGMPAEAATKCELVPPDFSNTLTVDTAGEVDFIVNAGGLDDTNCTLTINSAFPAVAALPATFTIRVGTMTVNANIINANPGSSTINLIATGGDGGTGNINVNNASIKARTLVNLTCTKAACDITVQGSELIATSTLAFGGPGGELRIDAKGDISITTTTFTGGELVKFTSREGTLTVVCGGGSGGCKDPNIPPIPQIVLDNCPPNAQTPPGGLIGFPCELTFLTPADLTAVCFPVVTPFCDGGSKEKDFIARGEINFENHVMTADRHLVISSVRGPIKGMNSNLDIAGATLISVDNCSTTASPCIDLRNAIIDSGLSPFNIVVKSGCAGSGVIDTTGATLTGDPVKINACGTVCPVGGLCPP